MEQIVRFFFPTYFPASCVQQDREGDSFSVSFWLYQVMMIFVTEGLGPAFGYENYPNITRWTDAMKLRDAYLKAEAKGGSLDLAAFVS